MKTSKLLENTPENTLLIFCGWNEQRYN